MSRSRKKPIVKDKGIGNKKYRRIVRRVQKYFLHIGVDIPNAKQIINDYNRCDYIFDFANTSDEPKYRRK